VKTSNRLRLVAAGLALAALGVVAVALAPADRLDPIVEVLAMAEGLLAVAVWGDTRRRMGEAPP
jgi:hypothetical protein